MMGNTESLNALVHVEVASGAERDLFAGYAFRVLLIETKA
jgi:hypothetical protein